MEDLQAQMNAILADPQMMQTIMGLAQNMSQSQAQPPPQPQQPQQANILDGVDLGMIQKVSGLARESNIDANQRQLLNALGPYLDRQRIHKLERAMRAAKLARVAAGFFIGSRNDQGR